MLVHTFDKEEAERSTSHLLLHHRAQSTTPVHPFSLQCSFTGMAQDLSHPIAFAYLGVATGFGKRSFAFCGAQLQWNLLPSDPRQTKHPIYPVYDYGMNLLILSYKS